MRFRAHALQAGFDCTFVGIADVCICHLHMEKDFPAAQ